VHDDALQLLIRGLPPAASLGIAGNKFDVRPMGAKWSVASAGSAALSDAEAWDIAHEASIAHSAFVEPDLAHLTPWPAEPATILGARPGEQGEYEEQLDQFPKGPGFAWHLGDNYSQLASARKKIEALGKKRAGVRIGILDVGFDFAHKAIPRGAQMLANLQRNFVGDGRDENDASDAYIEGFLKNPGHGTGTLSILAGPELTGMLRPEQNGIVLGANPFAEIIPCRIATSVVLLKTSAFVDAVRYLLAPQGDPALRADVLSMSMGGVASSAWADVVNEAYEAGLVMVTAAGNNFGAPKSIIFPARFGRVIAACGIMANGKPYDLPMGTMSGNHGPRSKMKTAISAYTPNISWAEVNAGTIVDMSGQGTSSATPQVAGAAGLWLARHKPALAGVPGWQVVESVRHALFSTAQPSPHGDELHLGTGVLKAADAVGVAPAAGLKKTPADSATFSLFRTLFGGLGQGIAAGSPREEMLALEASQLVHRDFDVDSLCEDPDVGVAKLGAADRRKILDAIASSPHASKTLRAAAGGSAAPPVGRPRLSPVESASPPKPGAITDSPPKGQAVPVPHPQLRRLRVYAFDPSLSTALETAHLNEVTIPVAWEKELQPGPVGEYVEIVDHDPPSGAFYAPVNLNDPHLLATDGIAPSEGNPQFHQQMVYAVAMRTIANFEYALGRKAQWSPRRTGEKETFVRRLRIYPHALREQNAYYQPDKRALLLGYFPARGGDPANVLAGGVVFTCLSHDIVAHEASHALLDGMHSRFNRANNPDILAFHEAFADIVAVFQHFSLPGLLEERIASKGGRLGADRLLGDLALEFGRATGLRRALRSAITSDPAAIDPYQLNKVVEAHDRGAILLAAVFDTFVRIYEARSRDLIRIATGGKDELPPGPVGRDLARRLAGEAAKCAQHVLNICIRALDYCPPVDLTFGDYLRALITADLDVCPVDDRGYRIAFVEAFRLRGIYPRDVRSMSVESLAWRQTKREEGRDIVECLGLKDLVRDFADTSPRFYSRDKHFYYTGRKRIAIEDGMRAAFASLPAEEARSLGLALGLDPALPYRVESLRVADKAGQYGRRVPQVIISVVQERAMPLNADGTGRSFLFEGGATIIVDPQFLTVRYAVTKNVASERRLAHQRAYLTDPKQGLHEVYFAAPEGERFAMMHKGGR
jgi:subtilisin family serine protease